MKFVKLIKSNMKKKAERMVSVPLSTYMEWLEKELKEANDAWGNNASIALSEKLLNLMEQIADDGGENNDPGYIADNFVVNGEFVSKEEFKQGGEAEGYFEQYNGNWQALCDDAIVYDDKYACMQF